MQDQTIISKEHYKINYYNIFVFESVKALV